MTIEVGATELSGESLSIDTLETNIASVEVSIEGVDTNIASAAVTIEGMAEVTGDMLIDGEQPVIIPLG
jgi:hypothetical protein